MRAFGRDKMNPKPKVALWPTILIICFTTTVIIVVSFSPLYNKGLDWLAKKNFETVSYAWSDDKLVESVVYACSQVSDERGKLFCIIDFVGGIYDFKNEEPLNVLRKNPEELVREGGVCRDYAVLYKALFDRMGWENELVMSPSHVYNKVWVNGKSFVIDGPTLTVEK